MGDWEHALEGCALDNPTSNTSNRKYIAPERTNGDTYQLFLVARNQSIYKTMRPAVVLVVFITTTMVDSRLAATNYLIK